MVVGVDLTALLCRNQLTSERIMLRSLLLLCFTCVTYSSTDTEECTGGFMDYDLLKQKASQIPAEDGNGALSTKYIAGSSYFASTRRYAMPSLKFTCPGTITGFLLGVDVRTDGSKNQYPSIYLFKEGGADYYTKVGSRDIILDAENFTTSGLFNYTLSEPLSFSTGQVLGVRQPKDSDSRVRFFYQSFTGHNTDRITSFVDGQWVKSPYPGVHLPNSRLLVRPITAGSFYEILLSMQLNKNEINLALFDDMHHVLIRVFFSLL